MAYQFTTRNGLSRQSDLYPESAGTPFYKCASVGSGTWTGYKAVQDSSTKLWSYESTLTSDSLTFDSSKKVPTVGNVYSADAFILASLYDDILLDAYTQFLLEGNLTDKSSNAIAVTNNGLTFDGSKITCNANSYAYIAANSLPASVLCDGVDWSLEIKFRCTDTSLMPSSDYSCLFGQGADSSRFDILINSSKITIGGFSLNSSWTPDTSWHVYKLTHTSANLFTQNIDDGSSATETRSSKNMRTMRLGIGWDVESRYGYPLEIEYIRISNCVR